MSIAQVIALVLQLMKNKELWELVQKIIEFIKGLNPKKQEAFTAFFNGMSDEQQFVYLNSLLPVSQQAAFQSAKCPNCPDDCKDVQESLVQLLND